MFDHLESWAGLAAVLLLVAREMRVGLGGVQDRLVKTLNETIAAQAMRITMLEASLLAANRRVDKLEVTLDVMREPKPKRARVIESKVEDR